MGSLMSGWDSFRDPKKVKLERNKSMTIEGIEAYWKSTKKDDRENLVKMKKTEEPEKKYQRSRSMVLTNSTKTDLINLDNDVNLEKFIQKKGWWTRSNSAFLNEPPVIASEGPTYKYASQFHVTGMDPRPEQAKENV